MKTLLTGATGLFGPYLARALAAAGHETVAVGRSALPRSTDWVECDLTDPAATKELFARVDPELVVHAAALTNVDLCERDPELADAVNRGTTATLAKLAGAAGSRLVLVSTDSVFDGTRGGYVEEDPTNPLNSYARSKLAAEHELAELESSLVVRTNFFGLSGRGHGLAEWLLRELRAGNEIVGFADVVFTPLYCGTVAELVVELASSGENGMLHLGAGDAVSKLEFALLVADVFGFDRTLVKSGSLDDVGLTAPRPHDTSLISTRAEHLLGRGMPLVAEGVAALRAESLVAAVT
jgi:dTDP-4-dehydrorhamnose reductase